MLEKSPFKDWVRLQLLEGSKHSQRSHPSECTFLKITFLYVSNITSKHNSLDCHNYFLKYFPLIAKFTCSNLETNQIFLHVQSTQTSRVDNPCFFQMFFLNQMCTIPFENWRGF
jgi:hypothetical protein